MVTTFPSIYLTKVLFNTLYPQSRKYDECERIRVEIVERGTSKSKVLQEITGYYRHMRSSLHTQFSPDSVYSALKKNTGFWLDPVLEGLDRFVNEWTTLISALQEEPQRLNDHGSVQVLLLGQGTPLPNNSKNAPDFVEKCRQIHMYRLSLYSMIGDNKSLLQQFYIMSMAYIPLIIMDYADFQTKLIDLYFAQYSIEFGLQFQPHLEQPSKYTTILQNYKEFFTAQEKSARSVIQNQSSKQIVYDGMKAFLAEINQYGKDTLHKAFIILVKSV